MNCGEKDRCRNTQDWKVCTHPAAAASLPRLLAAARRTMGISSSTSFANKARSSA